MRRHSFPLWVRMDKTVLITGASGSIGSACAEKFAAAGYNTVLNYNTGAEAAERLAIKLNSLGCSALTVCADISSESGVNRLFDEAEARFGSVDVLVNNAGVSLWKQLQDCTAEDYDRVFGVNMKGVFLCCRRALGKMLEKKSGCIVNVSSMWGASGASCEALYSASKAGVINFSRALAKELGPSGIRVNCVSPGVIDTKMNAHLGAEALNELARETPLMRLGSAAEVAAAVLFFASEEAGFITGQNLGVDGGFLL